ncbi:MAG: sigma factor-like helix-turn-helix DNA-binding protein [bacterium]|nr:sigma factor-like helix-turn-helix DNA-binding protein [bacterium]
MSKNLQNYYQAWKYRKEGKTLKEVGQLMGFSIERARIIINYTSFVLRQKKKDYEELKKIMKENL